MEVYHGILCSALQMKCVVYLIRLQTHIKEFHYITKIHGKLSFLNHFDDVRWFQIY